MNATQRKVNARLVNAEEKAKLYKERAEHDEETELGCYQDGRKRYSLHLDYYEGSPYLMLKKTWNGRHKQHLTWSLDDAGDLLELVARAAQAAAEHQATAPRVEEVEVA